VNTSVAGHYEILEKIGEGGYGEVYKGRDLHVPRFVALKFLYPHLINSKDAMLRFQQEARAVSALSHPNIVILHDFDTEADTGRVFLVLEYLAGGTLKQLIRRITTAGPLNPADLLRYAVSIAAGLSHAHRHGIIHRDVKPSNIMFSEERIVKLTDFGLAKAKTERDITEPGGNPGTVCYMSPEQILGRKLDHRTDIFSFGVVLYEMATGRLPFAASSNYEALQKITMQPVPLVRQTRPDLPEELDRIIQRATAKNPSERYQEMQEVENALLALQQQVATLLEQPTATMAPSRRSSRHWRLLSPVLLVLLLAAIGGIVWFRVTPFASSRPRTRLLAVVPFHCLAANESQQVFCEGLANTLSTKLTQMESLQDTVLVVPYSELRREGVTSATEANNLLKAQQAMTGSVEFAGDRVRINLNFVDAERKVQTGARVLDGSSGDLVRLQDETSEIAAGMLELRLRPADQRRIGQSRTRSGPAFDAFVRGLGYLSRSDAIEDARLAAASLKEAVRLDSRYALAWCYLGEAYLREYQKTESGQWISQARASCDQALKIDGRLTQAHITLAKVLQARTETEHAIGELRLALRIEPRNAEALRALGNAYAELGMRSRDPALQQEAIETFQEAIALRPELWTTYRDLGLAWYRLGEKHKAEEQFLRMLQLTGSADARWQMGALYHSMDRPEDAIVYLRRSLAIKPTPEAYANLGTVCFYLKRYDEVIPNYEQALRLNEERRTRSHVIWGNLAMAYSRTPGGKEKAQMAYAQAIRIATAKLAASPKHADTHASLAYYLVRTGDTNGALRHANEAMRLAPDVASILFRCGVVYERLQRRSQALAAIERALEKGHPLKEVLNTSDLAALRHDVRFEQYIRRSESNQ
jgi:serine/threonine protein kinase/Flp pilus assembly protein TadD